MPDILPQWLKEVAFDVEGLVRTYGLLRFHEMLEQFAGERQGAAPDGLPDLPLHRLALSDDPLVESDAEPTPLTPAERYAVLAAVHDGVCHAAAPIHPWRPGAKRTMAQLLDECDGDFEAAKAAFFGNVPRDYDAMVAFVSEARFCRSDSYSIENLRLNLGAVLEHVREDLSQAIRAKRMWTPPEGFVGVKTIQHGCRFRKQGVNPARSTIQRWQEAEEPSRIERDPESGECFYPSDWADRHWQSWRPRGRSSSQKKPPA